MKATETHLAIVAFNIAGAVALVASYQPWWFASASVVAGMITALAFQGSGAIARDAPRTGRIAAGEFLILASTLATGHMAAAVVGTVCRVCFFVTQMAAIGTFIEKPTAPKE